MLIQIDPSAVTNFLRLKKRRLLGKENKDDLTPRQYKGRRFSGLIVKDSAIQTGRPIEQCPHYRGTLQRFQEGLNWDQTEYADLYDSWYRQMNDQQYHSKSFEKFYSHRLQAWDELFEDIKNNGFKASDSARDNIEIAIDFSGRLLLIDGRHRLAMAQILELEKVPATVNIISESFARAFTGHAPSIEKQLATEEPKERMWIACKSANPKLQNLNEGRP